MICNTLTCRDPNSGITVVIEEAMFQNFEELGSRIVYYAQA